jgi:hypothetical protein
MGANQNSPRELDLYPKMNSKLISFNLIRPSRYKQAIDL